MITAVAIARPPTRCAFCHGSIVGMFTGCARCGTACHSDCMKLHGGCPTLGCETPRRSTSRRRRTSSRGLGAESIRLGVKKGLTALLRAGLLLFGIGVAVAFLTPQLVTCQRSGTETSAIGALKTIGAAQALFRESDRDGDGELDYAASLAELGDTKARSGLIDPVLASGLKWGYHFEVRRSEKMPEYLWIAYAWPAGDSGDRMFVANHTGVTYYRPLNDLRAGLLLINGDTCEIPAGWTPVGR